MASGAGRSRLPKSSLPLCKDHLFPNNSAGAQDQGGARGCLSGLSARLLVPAQVVISGSQGCEIEPRAGSMLSGEPASLLPLHPPFVLSKQIYKIFKKIYLKKYKKNSPPKIQNSPRLASNQNDQAVNHFPTKLRGKSARQGSREAGLIMRGEPTGRNADAGCRPRRRGRDSGGRGNAHALGNVQEAGAWEPETWKRVEGSKSAPRRAERV